MSKAPTEFIIFERDYENKIDEAKEAARAAQREQFKQKLQHEYDEWSSIRKYVREHMHILKGQKLPIEISSLQDITKPYNCVILNDMEMLPYLAVYEEIKLMEGRIEKIKNNQKIDAGECPKCGGAVIPRPDLFFWGGQKFAGHFCKDCNSSWDYNDSWMKYVAAHKQLEKEGRIEIK